MNAGGRRLLAEYDTANALLAAVHRVRSAGYDRLDAFTPFAVDGLAEALDFRDPLLPRLILLCGLFGGIAAFLFQYYVAVIAYPLNVGGKPYDSWPAFMLVTFEFTVLGAAMAAFVGMLSLNRLPQPYHPVFAAAGFERASQDRFFLSVDATDPLVEPEQATRLLIESGALSVQEVMDEPS